MEFEKLNRIKAVFAETGRQGKWLAKQLADYWQSNFPNGHPAFPDFSFFYEFEKAKIKCASSCTRFLV